MAHVLLPTVVYGASVQVEVCRVRVEGLKRTKNDIVVEQVKQLLGKRSLNEVSYGCHDRPLTIVYNIVQMLDVSLMCLHQLHSMNVFKEVELLYDVSRDQEGVVKGVEVVYQVKEAGIIHSSLSAHAGAQTSDAVSATPNVTTPTHNIL